MSIARWNLKEAAGKTLVRRTETRYEANVTDESAVIRQSPNLARKFTGVDLADISVEVSAHYPGRSLGCAIKLAPSQGGDDAARRSQPRS